MKLTFVWPMMMFAAASLASCAVDTAPNGLRRTPEGPGARVVFEPLRRPLPELPLPNDVATFADPTSRTGRRLNLSMVAPTNMEQSARSGFNELEGWGTYAPITVAFTRSETADPREAALDLEEIQRRMPQGDFEPGDDPVYIVNLKTGVPIILEMGTGRRPVVLRSPDLYWKNDPQAHESNLFFETREEGAGLTQDQYRPELDTDFDGVLDHPNTLGKQGVNGYDNLLTWYERETDTLNLRPLVPMEEKTEYAVILTDRLRGSDGHPIRSAFEYIHHPQQKDGAARVRDILDDPSRRAYYGDLSGTGLDRVAFVWTFTTQPVQEDLLLLRDGLYGKGPFARFAAQFPPAMHALPAAGSASPPDPQPEGWQSDPTCAGPSRKPYVFDIGDPKVLKSFSDTLASVTNPSPRDRAALDDSLSHVDHIIVGDFESPYLIGDPKHEQPEDHFHVNFKTGEGDVGTDKVHFWLVVPKETATHKQPFPIVVLGHGYGGQAENALDIGADMARQGIATVTIDMPHHGLALPASQEALLQAALSKICYSPFAAAVLMGRAQDVNGDGLKESGWWWWTPHLFHVRDNVRQGVLDSMQLTRILATFDGRTRSDQDLNGDGVLELAGDFDANGVPDVGAPITVAGGSLGGIIAQVQGGVDHRDHRGRAHRRRRRPHRHRHALVRRGQLRHGAEPDSARGRRAGDDAPGPRWHAPDDVRPDRAERSLRAQRRARQPGDRARVPPPRRARGRHDDSRRQRHERRGQVRGDDRGRALPRSAPGVGERLGRHPGLHAGACGPLVRHVRAPARCASGTSREHVREGDARATRGGRRRDVHRRRRMRPVPRPLLSRREPAGRSAGGPRGEAPDADLPQVLRAWTGGARISRTRSTSRRRTPSGRSSRPTDGSSDHAPCSTCRASATTSWRSRRRSRSVARRASSRSCRRTP